MFPDIRRSRLQKDVEEKRLALQRSREVFAATVRRRARPVSLLRRHPRIAAGAAFAFWTFAKGLVFRGSGKKSRFVWRLLKAGWFWRLAKGGGTWLLEKKRPEIERLGTAMLKSFLFRRSRPV